jgi:YHS domain-containing protein
MKKLSILSIMALAVCGVAVAQTKPAGKTPKTINCAVMPDDPVDVAKATKEKMYADHKGRRYYFCCAGCPGRFKSNPAKYEKGPSLPTPKSAKK